MPTIPGRSFFSAKQIKKSGFKSLTIPRGESEKYLAQAPKEG
jgi:hypothetical protein